MYRQTSDVRGLAQALMGMTWTRDTHAPVPLGSLPDLEPFEKILEALADRERRLRGRILQIMAEAYRNARQTAKAKESAPQALEIGQRFKDMASTAEGVTGWCRVWDLPGLLRCKGQRSRFHVVEE